MLANSCWQTQIGVCERLDNMLANCWRQIERATILANFFPRVCQHVVVSFTHINLSFRTRRVKAALDVMIIINYFSAHVYIPAYQLLLHHLWTARTSEDFQR